MNCIAERFLRFDRGQTGREGHTIKFPLMHPDAAHAGAVVV
jgi:hypothetical protein